MKGSFAGDELRQFGRPDSVPQVLYRCVLVNAPRMQSGSRYFTGLISKMFSALIVVCDVAAT